MKTIDEIQKTYTQLFTRNEALYHALAKHFQLSDCSLWILSYLLQGDPGAYTQSDLCVFLSQPRQTVNSALKKMETEKLIEFHYQENSKKMKRIFLTEKGILLAKKTASEITSAEKAAFQSLSNAERNTFLEIFEKYLTQLEQEVQKIYEIDK